MFPYTHIQVYADSLICATSDVIRHLLTVSFCSSAFTFTQNDFSITHLFLFFGLAIGRSKKRTIIFHLFSWIEIVRQIIVRQDPRNEETVLPTFPYYVSFNNYLQVGADWNGCKKRRSETSCTITET